MIVLDTNVISEMMNPAPDPAVVDWLSVIEWHEQSVAATVAAELLTGAAILPTGRRRDQLRTRIETTLARLEILPFDQSAARQFADIVATRRRAGQPISTFDAQIAATARAHDAAIATRDARGFTGCGIEIINPWNHTP